MLDTEGLIGDKPCMLLVNKHSDNIYDVCVVQSFPKLSGIDIIKSMHRL